jgi:hypothetical protein
MIRHVLLAIYGIVGLLTARRVLKHVNKVGDVEYLIPRKGTVYLTIKVTKSYSEPGVTYALSDICLPVNKWRDMAYLSNNIGCRSYCSDLRIYNASICVAYLKELDCHIYVDLGNAPFPDDLKKDIREKYREMLDKLK